MTSHQFWIKVMTVRQELLSGLAWQRLFVIYAHAYDWPRAVVRVKFHDEELNAEMIEQIQVYSAVLCRICQQLPVDRRFDSADEGRSSEGSRNARPTLLFLYMVADVCDWPWHFLYMATFYFQIDFKNLMAAKFCQSPSSPNTCANARVGRQLCDRQFISRSALAPQPQEKVDDTL